MDEHLVRSWWLEQRVAARRYLSQPASDGENEIGFAYPIRKAIVHGNPEDAGVARRAVVDEVLAAERARDRQLVHLAERENALARLRGPAALADDDERPLRCGEELPQTREVLVSWCGAGDVNGTRVGHVTLLGEHVFRKCEDHRPRPPRQRQRERTLDVLRDPVGTLDLPRGFGDPVEGARVVDLLPRFSSPERTRHLADEEKHRRRVLSGRVHPHGRLRRSRAARHDADPRPAGQLPVRLRCVRSAALVAAGDEPDRGVVERIEDRQKALSREAEREVGAVQLELVDEDPPPAPHSATRSSRRTVARWSFGFSSSAGSR